MTRLTCRTLTRRALILPALAALAPVGLAAQAAPVMTARRVAAGLNYGPYPRQRLDLWAPVRARDRPWPTLLVLDDDPERTAALAMSLAAHGFVAAAADYRRTPDVETGEAEGVIADAADAAALAARIAPAVGGQSGWIGVLGRSGGARAALMITLDRRYLAAAGATGRIRAAVALDPRTDSADPTLTQPATFVRAEAPALWLADSGAAPGPGATLAALARQAGGRAEAALYAATDAASAATGAAAFLHRLLA